MKATSFASASCCGISRRPVSATPRAKLRASSAVFNGRHYQAKTACSVSLSQGPDSGPFPKVIEGGYAHDTRYSSHQERAAVGERRVGERRREYARAEGERVS